jgi:AcrR family transcriptional regulator
MPITGVALTQTLKVSCLTSPDKIAGVTTTVRRASGPPAAARRAEVLEAARRDYLAGRRLDVRAIAAELGLARATVYRWFGSRDRLLGEVIAGESEAYFRRVRERVPGRGARALLETFDQINRGVARSQPLRRYLEQEREAALRTLTSSGGVVEPRSVEVIAELIEEEVRRGAYDPPVEPRTLAYAIVGLANAFLYNDAVAGIRGDVDRLRDVEAALLGVPRSRSRGGR